MNNRVLYFGISPNLGGVETLINGLYDNIEEFQIDFVVTSKEKINFENKYIEKGSRIIRINPRRKGVFKYWKELFNIFKKYNDYSIVHVHINSCSSIEPVIVAKLCGLKTIVHSHNSNAPGGKITKFLHKINKCILPFFADYYIACSDLAGKFMFYNNNINYLKNGIKIENYIFDFNKRENTRQFYNCENDFVICHIGIFNNVKNQTFVVDIFKDILIQHKNSKLILVGDGALKENVKQKCVDLGIEQNVIFTGICSDIQSILSASDIFVFPSLYEGLPLTLVEAQTSGIKVICSDTISNQVKITELIETHSLSQTSNQWAKAILKYSNGYNRKDMSEEIKKAGYDIKSSAKWLQEFYGEILNYDK